jgi:uroporphyrinogen-III synthase
MLRARGLIPLPLPMIHRVATGRAPPALPCELMLFTSAATLQFARNLPDVPTIAVGPATAHALQAAGHRVLAIGEQGGAEAAQLALAKVSEAGRIWLVGAEDLAAPLTQLLQQEPFCSRISHWPVYRTTQRRPKEPELPKTWDIVCFTSPSLVDAYVGSHLPQRAPNARLLAIGPTTAARVLHHHLPTPEIAKRPALEALADLAQYPTPHTEAPTRLAGD